MQTQQGKKITSRADMSQQEDTKDYPIPWERKWISKEEAKEFWPDKYVPNQTCRFCNNPESILTPETCCTGCSKLT